MMQAEQAALKLATTAFDASAVVRLRSPLSTVPAGIKVSTFP